MQRVWRAFPATSSGARRCAEDYCSPSGKSAADPRCSLVRTHSLRELDRDLTYHKTGTTLSGSRGDIWRTGCCQSKEEIEREADPKSVEGASTIPR